MWFIGTLLSTLSVVVVFSVIRADLSCDTEYGEHCPSESGWGVGQCLLKQKDSLSKACIDFIDLQSICKDDIEKNCNGKEYTGDLLVCLTEWTKPESLSAVCLDKIPKKAAKEERKLSAAEKMKADRRRKARKEAAKRVKKEL